MINPQFPVNGIKNPLKDFNRVCAIQILVFIIAYQYSGLGTGLSAYSVSSFVFNSDSTSLLAITVLWRLTCAPIWLLFGLVSKYSVDSASLTFSTAPSIRTLPNGNITINYLIYIYGITSLP